MIWATSLAVTAVANAGYGLRQLEADPESMLGHFAVSIVLLVVARGLFNAGFEVAPRRKVPFPQLEAGMVRSRDTESGELPTA